RCRPPVAGGGGAGGRPLLVGGGAGRGWPVAGWRRGSAVWGLGVVACGRWPVAGLGRICVVSSLGGRSPVVGGRFCVAPGNATRGCTVVASVSSTVGVDSGAVNSWRVSGRSVRPLAGGVCPGAGGMVAVGVAWSSSGGGGWGVAVGGFEGTSGGSSAVLASDGRTIVLLPGSAASSAIR